jgi:hypothetical protein
LLAKSASLPLWLRLLELALRFCAAALFEVDEARVTPLSDVPMKTPCCLLLLIVSISAGCARHYNIMLNNGRVITALGKPKLNSSHDAFLYKDAEGKPGAVSAGSVKEIERR